MKAPQRNWRRRAACFGASGCWMLSAFSACGDHEPVLDRVGGPLPNLEASAGDGPLPEVDGDASFCSLPPADIAGARFPCDIDAVLTDKCRRCHQDPPLNGAPFPLIAWSKTQEIYFGKPIWERMREAVKTGYMPFCSNLPCANNYDPPVQPLTVEQTTTMLTWLDCPQPYLGAPCSD